MTDAFESEVQKFVSRQNGDDLTPKIVYGMLRAVDEDAVRRHGESVAAQAKIVEMLEEHCEEAVVRDRRIADLEAWRTESQATCSARVTALIQKEHAERHGNHLANEHAPAMLTAESEDDFHTKLVWFFAQTTGKVVLVLLGGIAAVILNLLLYGRP